MKTRLSDISMLMGAVVAVVMAAFGAFSRECEALEPALLRLHIMANSDSAEDQTLKLELRDHMLGIFIEDFKDAQSIDEAKAIASEKTVEYSAKATEFVHSKGFDYDVTAKPVEMYFNTREYDEYTIPAGVYSALRFEIGSGKGKNWWCVMFPSLCLPAASDYEDLSEDDIAKLSKDELKTFRTFKKEGRFKVKFAVYEFFKGLLC